jgi:hypothetical protein
VLRAEALRLKGIVGRSTAVESGIRDLEARPGLGSSRRTPPKNASSEMATGAT